VKGLFAIIILSAAAYGQPGADPKPPFTPSYEVHISPTTKTDEGRSINVGPDYWVARGFDLEALIARLSHTDPLLVDFPFELKDAKRYDFSVVLPKAESEAQMEDLVKHAIQERFHLSISPQRRDLDVLVLTAPNGKAPALKPANQSPAGSTSELSMEDDHIAGRSVSMNHLRRLLEDRMGHPVIDETNLTGRYDFDVRGAGKSQEQFIELLRNQLGLPLTPQRRNIEMIVVTR